MLNLEEIRIVPADAVSMENAGKHWNRVAKPLHSLGKLEDLIVRMAGAQGTEAVQAKKRAVAVFCSDNGVVQEDVAQSDPAVTAVVSENIARGRGNINSIAATADCTVRAVDVGIAADVSAPEMICRKIARGTRNFAKEPAMTEEEALKAVAAGFDTAAELAGEGFRLLAAGEMGIGNTTTSTAVTAALLKKQPAELAGRGAGLDDAGLSRKIRIIEEALDRYDLYGAEPLRILSCVGGFDLAAMAGFYIGCAVHHIPAVLDGCISTTAALLAERLVPGTKDYLLASHNSREKIAAASLDALGLSAVLDANLALGEGTGAVLLFPLLDCTLSVYRSAATFEESAISAYEDSSQGSYKVC